MASVHVIKRIKYKTTIKDPGTAGTLTMTPEKILFVPHNPKSSTKLDVEFWFIKGQKNTKEGSTKPPPLLKLTNNQNESCIFEFENYSDLHDCRDFVRKVLEKRSVTYPEELTAAEMELRLQLLQEDRELQKLHMQLVFSGVLTEAEFWGQHERLSLHSQFGTLTLSD